MAMSNPFARPRTTAEWLRSSLCWTGACLGACLLVWLLAFNVLPFLFIPVPFGTVPVSLCAAHALIWTHAVAGGRAIIRQDEQKYAFSWTRLAAHLWLGVLTLFQVACLLGPVMLIGWALFELLVAPSTPSTSSEPFFG